jgi:P4 family phage/plasmid primase-like protien
MDFSSVPVVDSITSEIAQVLDLPITWKTEGPMDLAALTSCMLSLDLIYPHRHGCWTNKHGAGENPLSIDATGQNKSWWLEQFRGKIAYIVHDCDQPGQSGALEVVNGNGRSRPGWAPVIAQYADECRNVVLPSEISESKGDDLEDFLEGMLLRYLELGYEMEKARAHSYLSLLLYAQSQLVIEASEKAFEQFDESESKICNESDGDSEIFESVDDPHRLARMNLEHYAQQFEGGLRFWGGEWWRYRDGQYRKIDTFELKAKLNQSIRKDFENCWRLAELARIAEEEATGKEIKRQPIAKVTGHLVNNVIQAMESQSLLSGSIEMPCWLPDRSKRQLISMENGLLDLDRLFKGDEPEDCLLPHAKDWFSTVKLPLKFDPDAKCPRWLEFVHQVFDGDMESIRALQMWCGYLLTQRTDMQKMMMVIGPPRSGKGTISRTIKTLLGGAQAVCNPTLASIANNFEMHSWHGKSLALINEARLPSSVDATVITERLLSIVGEDSQDIHRKFMAPINSVKMNLRFMLFMNQLPRLNDDSSALVSRCIVLVMPNSYLGRENMRLGDELIEELPGIFLNWLAGLKMLTDAGRIHQPSAGLEVIQAFKAISSPMSIFLEEECDRSPTAEVNVSDIFEMWKKWCSANGIQEKDSIQLFSRRIRSLMPSIQTRKLGYGDRSRVFIGIDLKNRFNENF